MDAMATQTLNGTMLAYLGHISGLLHMILMNFWSPLPRN